MDRTIDRPSPAPSLAEFEKLVSRHEIHYFVSGSRPGGPGGTGEPGALELPGAATGVDESTPGGFAVGGPGGGSGDASQITSWVQAHFTSETVGSTTVYALTSPK